MANNDLIRIQEAINTHKNNLANNLNSHKVAASGTETLTALISKINDIKGGADWSNVTNLNYYLNRDSTLSNGPIEPGSPLETTIIFMINLLQEGMQQVEHWDSAFAFAITTPTANEAFQNKHLEFTHLSPGMFSGCSELTDVNVKTPFKCLDIDWEGNPSISSVFSSCEKLPLLKVLKILESNTDNNLIMTSAMQNIQSCSPTPEILGNIHLHGMDFSAFASGWKNVKSIGDITLETNPGQSITIGGMFRRASVEEVGTITLPSFVNGSGVVDDCSNLRKFGGIIITEPQNQQIHDRGPLIGDGARFPKLEELLNIPVSICLNGPGNVFNPWGRVKAPPTLKRLTFSMSNYEYYNKDQNKDFDISNCSFTRAAMVEMFNTLPDANSVTGTKNINIIGNPCVNDGSLTQDDIAIATAKGYTVQTV